MRYELDKKYKSLFQKYKDLNLEPHILNRGIFFQYDEDETECDILFIGINPSYTDKDTPMDFIYTRRDKNEPDLPHYFKVFHDFNDKVNEDLKRNDIKWTHIDLLVFRETQQSYVWELLKQEHGPAFVWEQVQIAKERIARIQPKVIVVANTMARELMGKNRHTIIENGKEQEVGVWMDYRFEFDDDFGAYRITNVPELKDTYVFFTSMLSGQRALDLGSRERLIWQVKRVFEKK